MTNLVSITVNRNPTTNTEVSNRKYKGDELDKITILKFNQSLKNYFIVTDENTKEIFMNYDRTQIEDTKINNSHIPVDIFYKIGKQNAKIKKKLGK